MPREQFAARFGFSRATLRHWERGDRSPRGPSLALLDVIERNPEALIETLARTCRIVRRRLPRDDYASRSAHEMG